MPPIRFRPPLLRDDVLPRPQLVEALAAHIDRKLQLVLAPAGYGKTSLLAEFAADTALTSCWISLSRDDGDLADFISLLLTALGRHVPNLGRHTRATLTGFEDIERGTRALARSLASDLEESVEETLLLILDDFQDVNESAPVTRFLGEFLRVLPDTLRIVLASRSMPNLPLSQLAVEHDLFSLSVTDLRFTTDELQELLRRRGVEDLPPERVATLGQQVDGWITGFLLVAPPLRAALAGDALAGGRGDSLMYDYLAGEVFDRQPTDLQRFLLASSVPATADPALCTALLGPGDWEQTARAAAAAGLFLTVMDDGSGAFRYHQPFRDFLQARLQRVAPADAQHLHVIAGEAMAAQGAWQAALTHFREANALVEAVRLVGEVVPRLQEQRRWRAVDTAVRSVPPDLLGDQPALVLAAALAAHRLGDLPRAIALAEQVRTTAVDAADRVLEARALARLGMISRSQGRTREAIERLNRAQELAPDDAELTATVQQYLGQIAAAGGDLDAALERFRAALAYFDESGSPGRAADVEGALATTLDFAGRLPEAAARYASVRDRWQHLGNDSLEAFALAALGDVRRRRGDYTRARDDLEQALVRVRSAGDAERESDVLVMLGGLWLAAGEPATARVHFDHALEVVRQVQSSRPQIQILDGLALTCAFQGDLAQAEEYAYQAVGHAERSDQRLLVALCAMTLGAIQWRAAHPQALTTLERAAEALNGMQAGWQMARAQLWLAQFQMHLGDRAAAFGHLQSALDLAQVYGTDAVLDLHIRWDAAVFVAAQAAGIAPERLAARLACATQVASAGTPPGADTVHQIDVRGFGLGTVTLDGAQVVWKRDKSRELLFLLLHHRPQRSELLTETLWPDSAPTRALPRLHMAVSHLRSAVHPRLVVRTGSMYDLDERTITEYDVAEFERLLREASIVAAGDAVPLLRRAVDLYRAPFLSETSAEWCELERDRLEQLYLMALTRLADLHDALGQHHESIAAAERVLQTDPYREDAYARIIRAHLRLGNNAAAAHHYAQCARLLRDDLGVDPGPEIVTLLRKGP